MIARELLNEVRELGDGPTVVMGVGANGLGKSEVLSALASEYEPEALYVTYPKVRSFLDKSDPEFARDSDNLRQIKIGNAIRMMSADYLCAQGSVVLDIGHTNYEARRNNAKYFGQLGISGVMAVHFTVQNEFAAVGRYDGSGRGKRIMTHALKALRIHPPTCDEGFDKLVTIDATDKNDMKIVSVKIPR